MKNIKRFLAFTLYILFMTDSLFAQTQVISKFTAFRDNWMKPLYPIVLAIVLLGGAIFNIGMVWGDNKEWKTFFTKIGLYLLAAFVIVGVFEAVFAMQI